MTDRDLQTAALLRWSRDGGALRPDRGKAILDDLLARPAAKTGPATRTSWLRWALPAGALAAIVVAIVIGRVGPTGDRAASPAACAVPEPPVALLRAQASRSAELDREMSDYRRAVWGALSGCAGSTEPGGSPWHAMADDAGRTADEAIAQGRVDDARRALRRIVETPAPADVARGDVRVIVRDATGRLARIELEAGNPREAIAWADRGLAHGAGADVFSAALLLARGRAKEEVGDDREALDDYVRAQRIDEVLLERALED